MINNKNSQIQRERYYLHLDYSPEGRPLTESVFLGIGESHKHIFYNFVYRNPFNPESITKHSLENDSFMFIEGNVIMMPNRNAKIKLRNYDKERNPVQHAKLNKVLEEAGL